MILIIGGEAQGKRAFAEEKWAQEPNDSVEIKAGVDCWVGRSCFLGETFCQAYAQNPPFIQT